MSDITQRLIVACGHDSRTVDGCANCEAADTIDALRAELAIASEALHHCQCALSAKAAPTAQPVQAAPVSAEDALHHALTVARNWIVAGSHGECCDYDERNVCDCGYESTIQGIDAALAAKGEKT